MLLVGMAKADGLIAPDEAEWAITLARPLLGEGYGLRDFQQDAERFRDSDMWASLNAFAGMTNEHGKAMLLETATLLAVADGEIHEAEKALIHDMAKALDIPKSYVPGIVQSALASLHETNAETPPRIER